MILRDFEELPSGVSFLFKRRPSPLPGDLRPTWRVSLLLLMLLYSRGQKASLQKLHVLSWALHSEETRELLVKYADGEISKDEIIPRIEPSLNRAISFATAEKLVIVEAGKNLKLEPKGAAAARELEAADVFSAEKGFLQRIKPFLTEQNVKALLDWSLL